MAAANCTGAMSGPIEITCIDCHGGVNNRATLRTSGLAAPGWSRPREAG